MIGDPRVHAESGALIEVLEYLLDVRQRQLGEELSDASRRGDREWSGRLRAEIDVVSRLLQTLRTNRDLAPNRSGHA